jgi:hypothetical protein
LSDCHHARITDATSHTNFNPHTSEDGNGECFGNTPPIEDATHYGDRFGNTQPV